MARFSRYPLVLKFGLKQLEAEIVTSVSVRALVESGQAALRPGHQVEVADVGDRSVAIRHKQFTSGANAALGAPAQLPGPEPGAGTRTSTRPDPGTGNLTAG